MPAKLQYLKLCHSYRGMDFSECIKYCPVGQFHALETFHWCCFPQDAISRLTFHLSSDGSWENVSVNRLGQCLLD